MNKIKYSILLISALCISFSVGLAQVNVHSSLDHKEGIGSFSASVLLPLTVHDVQPYNIGPKEYVKGATYTLLSSLGASPMCQYTVRGEKNKNMYVKVIGSTVGSDGKEIKDNGQGLKLYVTWTIDDGAGETYPYSGSNLTPYPLFPQGTAAYGARVLNAQFIKLEIDANAVSGNHIFYQTIEVSYNTGF